MPPDRSRPDLRCSRSPSPRPRSAPSPPRSRPASSLAFLLLTGFGLLLQTLRRKVPPRQAAVAGAGARQHRRPGSLARSIAVSLGLGLGLLVAVALIHRSLIAEISSNIAADAPAYYFLDVEAADLAAFKDKVRAVEPAAKLDDAPMLRGRIVALKGVPVEKVEAAPDAAGCSPATAASPIPTPCRQARPSSRANGGPKAMPGRRWSRSTPSCAKGSGLKLGDTDHREHSRPQCRSHHRLAAQDRLGVARHQFRHGVLAQHAGRRAPPHADHARAAEGHRPGARRQSHPGAGGGLSRWSPRSRSATSSMRPRSCSAKS